MLKSPQGVGRGASMRSDVRRDIVRILQNDVYAKPITITPTIPTPPDTTVTDDDFAAWIAAL